MLEISAREAQASRRQVTSRSGIAFAHTSFLGTNKYAMAAASAAEPDVTIDDLYPMAFLVEQNARTTFPAHYHRADQFQVMVHGGGKVGRHVVATGAVHYANAFTPYGPISADAEGLHYFTLRNGWDPGSRHMPESAMELRDVPRKSRQAVAEIRESLIAEKAVDGHTTYILPLDAEGLGIWFSSIPAGQSVIGPAPAQGRGQYWLVWSGALQGRAAALPPLSCVFIAPDDPPFVATASEAGLQIVGMQFPQSLPSRRKARD